MNNRTVRFLLNPFERIAGFQALSWGFLGLVLSTGLAYFTDYHYHGLLHYGSAPNPAWWCFMAEHFIVWLIPALLFYIGGMLLSRSRIRALDVFGTVLFAQIPLLFTNLIAFLPFYKQMSAIDPTGPLQEQIAQSESKGMISPVNQDLVEPLAALKETIKKYEVKKLLYLRLFRKYSSFFQCG